MTSASTLQELQNLKSNGVWDQLPSTMKDAILESCYGSTTKHTELVVSELQHSSLELVATAMYDLLSFVSDMENPGASLTEQEKETLENLQLERFSSEDNKAALALIKKVVATASAFKLRAASASSNSSGSKEKGMEEEVEVNPL